MARGEIHWKPEWYTHYLPPSFGATLKLVSILSASWNYEIIDKWFRVYAVQINDKMQLDLHELWFTLAYPSIVSRSKHNLKKLIEETPSSQ